MLLVGTLAVFVSICFKLIESPEVLGESAKFAEMKWCAANGHPVIPLLFVTIACGIISGFHATQSPISGAVALIAGIIAAWLGAGLFPVSVICCALVFLIELFI